MDKTDVPSAADRGSGLSDQLGHVRSALDGLAFAAHQAGESGLPLGDSAEVREWLESVMCKAAELLAAERESIKARLIGMDEAVAGRHNYYAHAAWVLFDRKA